MAEWLSERVSPERLYWEIKWGSRIWFALAAELLKDTLPVILYTGWRSGQQRPWGMNRGAFMDGCPAEWAGLPRPPAPLPVGIDGWLPSAVGRPANTI